jgi:DNA polymerase III subunit epsilon
MIQLAGIIEIDGEVKEKFDLLFQPFKDAIIENKALEVNGHDKTKLCMYPKIEISQLKLKKTLGKYVDKFDTKDKFVMAGYNVGFDEDFLRDTFNQVNDKFFGSWFFNAPMDVRSIVGEEVAFNGLRLKNYKLVTLCEYFEIELDAHNPVSDIEATKNLYYLLRGNRVGELKYG